MASVIVASSRLSRVDGDDNAQSSYAADNDIPSTMDINYPIFVPFSFPNSDRSFEQNRINPENAARSGGLLATMLHLPSHHELLELLRDYFKQEEKR